VLQIFRELHNSGHTILMVTHDPDIARQAIAVSNSPTALALIPCSTALDIRWPARWSTPLIVAQHLTDDEIRFDHLLEQVWICGEKESHAGRSFARH